MSSPGQGHLPQLTAADFGPGKDHVAEPHHNGKIFAIVHKDDPVRLILPNLTFAPDDPYTYIFLHGGQAQTRFENMEYGTHEIPAAVAATLLKNQYGARLNGVGVRMCTCYGNLLRPGDAKTAVQLLAALLPQTAFEGYHGLVRVLANPAEIRLGLSIKWDPQVGPVVAGPPGNWEPVVP
jgi:hypothetical protein